MDLESPKAVWDKLKETFEGTNRVKAVKLLTQKKEFALLKMKDFESIKDYSCRLMDLVNQIRLHGEALSDQKVVEKILISVPERFESKILAIEESCDLQKLTIVELMSKLQAQEQRFSMRSSDGNEEAFSAIQKGKNQGHKSGHKAQPDKANKGKAAESSSAAGKKGKFPPCPHCKKINHAEKYCWSKGKPVYQCNFCKKLGHIEKFCYKKKNQAQQQPQQEVNVIDEAQQHEEQLFMASQSMKISHTLS